VTAALTRKPSSRFDRLIDKLRIHGHRITPQRLAIFKVLVDSEAHPTVDQIYAEVKMTFPTTSLATVYKSVSVAKTMGEALELEFSQGSNRYDGRKPYPHPHVICTRCHKITDSETVEVDQMMERIVRETGFQIENHRLEFYGICADCQVDIT
jgi:Fur family peroxide stress response transcriptional regulator